MAESVTLTPTFIDPRQAYLRPDRVVVQSEYFYAHWAPRLGPERTLLVITLRRLSVNGAPVTISTGELAAAMGLTDKQVQALLRSEPLSDQKHWRQLKLPTSPTPYKAYVPEQIRALRHFIPRVRYAHDRDPATGQTWRTGLIIEIRLDDPLTPEDQAALVAANGLPPRAAASATVSSLNAEMGVEGATLIPEIGVQPPTLNAKIGVQPPLNAKIGALTFSNLTVTEANASGVAAAPSLAPFTPPMEHGCPAAPGTATPADRHPAAPEGASTSAPAASGCSPQSAAPARVPTVKQDLPLPQLRAAALADLGRQRRPKDQIAIVTKFAGRLVGLGYDDSGLVRRDPLRGDYARVGELCRDFAPVTVLTQLFAIAGRLPTEVADPLAYLRSSLEPRSHPQAAPPTAAPPAKRTGAGARVDISQFTAADYRAGLPGGGA